MPLPDGITREHVIRAAALLDQGRPHKFGKATKYELVLDNSHYAPKAVIGVAAELVTGRAFLPEDFSSGQAPGQAVAVLRDLGFEVLEHAAPWTLQPGHSIVRTQLHDLFGGSRQGGISPSRTSPNVLLFTDPEVGERFGYFDGWKPDGLFHYTGEGQRGDMRMMHGNLAVLAHRQHNRSLRLFDGARGSVLYVGEFELAEDPSHYRVDAPDRDGRDIREAIVFRLRPIDIDSPSVSGPPPIPDAQSVTEIPVEAQHTTSSAVAPVSEPTEAERREASLVQRYKSHLEAKGLLLVSYRCHTIGEARSLVVDVFDKTRNNLIEAKGTCTRQAIRMAIGQLADYSRFFESSPPRRAVLLPRRPRPDLEALLTSQCISVVWETPSSFADNADGTCC